jgi:SHAQKYF class myb-like DNA-binding protein
MSTQTKPTNGRWTEEEHEKFLEAIKEFGKDWRMVEKTIGTRSSN